MTALDYLFPALKLCAVLGCGLIAGVFFAFSTFIMPALARLEPIQGAAAMQSINIKAIDLWFMMALFGTAIVCLFLFIYSLGNWHQSSNIYLFLGSSIYLIGTIGITIVFNVPLNNTLAIAKLESAEIVSLWSQYLTDWTWWNHLRTIAASIAAALFAITLYY